MRRLSKLSDIRFAVYIYLCAWTHLVPWYQLILPCSILTLILYALSILINIYVKRSNKETDAILFLFSQPASEVTVALQ